LAINIVIYISANKVYVVVVVVVYLIRGNMRSWTNASNKFKLF